jgi:outer membrane protein TolC
VVGSVTSVLLAMTLLAPAPVQPSPAPPTAPLRLPATAPSASLALSLDEAIARGLASNLSALVADADVDASRGRRWQALSALLPHASVQASAVRQKINLAAFGFMAPGIPDIIGPFNVFDGRVNLSQTVVDLAAMDRARSEASQLVASRHDSQDARRLVALVVTNLYLDTLAASSRIDAGRAELESARALLRLAEDRKAAGVVPRIDVLRAQVQFEGAQQRQIGLENTFAKDKLALAQAIGLTPVTADFTLSDSLTFVPASALTAEQALEQAREARLDVRAAQARVEAARTALRAARETRLPSLQVHADYGTIGNTMELAHPTFAVGAAVAVPVFDGQMTHGRIVEAQAELDRVRAEAADLDRRIEMDVQAALLDVKAAEQQVTVAAHTVQLANEQQVQAADRFKAGVANNVEVVQAQAAVAAANDAYIAGVAAHNLAKAALARAIGLPESAFRQFLAGER